MMTERKILKDSQVAIDEVMDWFDFSKVATAMAALNWTWHSKIPQEPEIRKTARILLNKVLGDSREESHYATGGLAATKKDDMLTLEFVLTDWEVDLTHLGE